MPRGRNDYETAQIQGRLWTPDSLRAKAWHDASDISTITITGSGVSDWRDKSGNGITLSQSTDANRPSVVASGQSENTAIYFADEAITKLLSLSGSAPFSSGAEMSVFWVNKTPPNANNDNWPWQWTFADDAARIAMAGPFQSSVIYYADFNGFTGSNRISGNGPAHGTWAVFRARNSVANSIKAVHANGASALASTASGSSGTLTTYKLGSGPTGSTVFNAMMMGEILVFDRDLPTPDCLRIEGYLSWKWNVRLAADHPFANRPPLTGD